MDYFADCTFIHDQSSPGPSTFFHFVEKNSWAANLVFSSSMIYVYDDKVDAWFPFLFFVIFSLGFRNCVLCYFVYWVKSSRGS